MTALEQRQSTALRAARWCGTKEGSVRHGELLSIYNSQNPLPRGYRVTDKDAWCAAFVSAVALESGMEGVFPLECSCAQMQEQAERMGIWKKRDGCLPQTGDLVLYDWDVGTADHVGMVLLVEGSTLHVVEGNYENAVKVRRISAEDRRILGFVCPKYGDMEVEAQMVYHKLEEVPDYGRGTVEKLMQEGSLKGVAEDDLGLSQEMLRLLVILDRRGKL